jgi:RHS repeat-associated protein
MAKKYVPAGVFLTCDKGTLPTTLIVTNNANTLIYGQNLATDLDKMPGINVPPMGVCAITKVPCVMLPGAWSPVKSDVQLGAGHPLLEDSKLQCTLGGRVGIHFSLAAAQAACAPPPAPEKSAADKLDDYLKTLGPLGDYGRFQLGVAEGLWEGGKGLAEGLWGMAKGGWDAVTHPVDTANAIAEGASNAYQWAGKSENWSNAASSAGQGISDAAAWAGNGENWQKVGDKLQNMSPRDWGNVTGQVAFEVGLTAATAGAGTALNAAAKTSRVARMALRAGRVLDVEGHALGLAARATRSLAGKMKVMGKVVTGAKRARKAEKAAKAGRKAKRLKGVTGKPKSKRTCLNDPIDVATGVMLFDQVDLELPGPIPFTWERTWYSNSEYSGPLGHGWHHNYDLALAIEEDGTVALRLADGRLVLFEPLTPANNYCAFDRSERLEVQRQDNYYRVADISTKLYYCFVSFAAPNQSTAVASTAYVLMKVENANGFAIRFEYNLQGFLHTIWDSAGRELRLILDAHGRIEALEAPLPEGNGRFAAMRYQYDEAGNMTAAVDALGHSMQHVYQGHLMVEKKLRSGFSFHFEYDGSTAEAKCVRTWGDEDMLNGQFIYELGLTTVHSSQPGDVNVYQHHDGLVIMHTDPLGAVRQWTYNDQDELVLERDPLGQSTAYEYDARGNQTSITYPTGAREQSLYNEQDLLVQVTNSSADSWQWTYDEAGNILTHTDAVGETVSYAYSQGLLSAIDNRGIRLQYDAHYNLAHVVTADGRIRSLAYDFLGQLVKLTNAAGHVEHRRYNLLGQLTNVQEADGSEGIIAYDAEGNIIRAQDALQTVEMAYNSIGQVVRRRQEGAETVFHYDTQGRLTGLDNGHQFQYRFVLDLAGRVVEEQGFDGQTRRYGYDVAGRAITMQKPSGRTTHYSYDGADRVTGVQYDDGSQEQYQYTPDGLLLEAINAHAVVRFEYDEQGHLLTETQNGHVVESSYDESGLRAALSSSLGAEVYFGRDAYGRVAQIQAGTWQSKMERDANGLELHRQLSGNVRTMWQRDALGRPTRQRVVVGQQPARQRCYTWQGADQLTEIDDSVSGITRFLHDRFGALAATHYADGTQELRQPDAVGNLFRSTDRQDRRYSPSGQLREANGTRYRYDADGNLTHKTTATGQHWRYEWDGADQLVRVTCPNGYAVDFTYDALGRRISKRYRGRVTRWVWDGDAPLHEWYELALGPDAGAVQELTTWLFEDEGYAPMAKLTASGNHSVLTDHLGTPIALYDGHGRLSWEAELDSYGAVRRGRGQAQDCPFRYQGQYEDVETGLYYNRFRYYDPEAGVYISQDPIGLAGGGALHAYVADPLTQLDVFGLSEGSGTLANRMVKAGMTHGIPGFKKGDFRAHHVIPHQVWTQNQDFFDDIGLGKQAPNVRLPRNGGPRIFNHKGYNPKDAPANGVFLPKDEATGLQHKFDIYHAKGHPDTNTRMGAEVTSISDRFYDKSITKAQARKEISALQKAERKFLSSRCGKGCTLIP